MALRLMPDVEALVIDYLLADPSVAAIAGNRIGTKVRGTFPSVSVQLITGREIVQRHLDEQQIQVDAWGTSQESASILARTVRAVMLEAMTVSHARGVVTNVRTISPPRWLPDTSVTPPAPRYLGEYGVTLHPHPLVP